MKQVNVLIDDQLKKDADHAMIDTGRNLTQVVRDALTREVVRPQIVEVDEEVMKLARRFARPEWSEKQAIEMAIEIQLTAEIARGDWKE